MLHAISSCTIVTFTFVRDQFRKTNDQINQTLVQATIDVIRLYYGNDGQYVVLFVRSSVSILYITMEWFMTVGHNSLFYTDPSRDFTSS